MSQQLERCPKCNEFLPWHNHHCSVVNKRRAWAVVRDWIDPHSFERLWRRFQVFEGEHRDFHADPNAKPPPIPQPEKILRKYVHGLGGTSLKLEYRMNPSVHWTINYLLAVGLLDKEKLQEHFKILEAST